MAWIGVDLDGTLAYGHEGEIGPPIPLMEQRVKKWLAEGKEIRIFTARACNPNDIPRVISWLIYYGFTYANGTVPKVTNAKDYAMVELWDDRAISVETNTGIITTKRKE